MELLTLATLVDHKTGEPYVSMVFTNGQEWRISGEYAISHMLNFAECVSSMRDIREKQMRSTHGGLQYAESRAFYDRDFSNE